MNPLAPLALVIAVLAAPQGWLGIEVAPLAGQSGATRVVVLGVVRGGPAAAAGIRPGDQILSFGGAKVRDHLDLARRIQEHVPGDSVPVVLAREGMETTLPVRIGTRPVPAEGSSRPPEASPASGSGSRPGKVTRGYLGVDVIALTPGLRGFLGMERGGLLVTQVGPGSPAEKAGIAAGDVISGVNGKAVEDPFALQTVVRPLRRGESVALEIQRRGEPSARTVKVEVAEREADALFLTPEGLVKAGAAAPDAAAPQAMRAYVDALRQQLADPVRRQEMAEALRRQASLRTEDQAAALRDLEKRFEERIRELEQRILELEKRLAEKTAPPR